MIKITKQALGKVIILLLPLPASLLLIAAFVTGNYTAWRSSVGPTAKATILHTSKQKSPKSAIYTYQAQLVYALSATDSVTAVADISRSHFQQLHPHDQTRITYDPQHPEHVLLASEHWFQWKSVSVLLLGIGMLWACTQAIYGKPQTKLQPIV